MVGDNWGFVILAYGATAALFAGYMAYLRRRRRRLARRPPPRRSARG